MMSTPEPEPGAHRDADTLVQMPDERWLAAAVPHLVWLARPDGGFYYVNARWCAYTGLSPTASYGAGWQQALHPDDLALWRAAWQVVAYSGQPLELDFRLRRHDGSYHWFLAHMERLRDAHEPRGSWVGTATDIEVRKQQEQRTAAAQDEANQATRGRDTFIDAAVHDLNNQLQVIRGTAQLLQRHLVREPAAPEPQRIVAGLTVIQGGTTKMGRLVGELLDLSRLQRGAPMDLDCRPTDLVALARACVAEYAQTTDHELTVVTTEEQLVGNWDGPRLERVLANLLSNAIKYSDPGSAIQVAIDHDGSGRHAVAVLTVQDQGVGIPAQDLPHIFAPFYRGSNVVGRTAGTGIGLRGARAIVEQHGGTLELQSSEGRGTRVTVRLPLSGG